MQILPDASHVHCYEAANYDPYESETGHINHQGISICGSVKSRPDLNKVTLNWLGHPDIS